VRTREQLAAFLGNHGIEAHCTAYSDKSVVQFWKIVSDSSVSQKKPERLKFLNGS
jgi:hypothetical protein